jgi:tRNA threonylcarbamoyladenosine biosynthesis protein TsaB
VGQLDAKLMPSLRQLLAAHPTLLLIDSASARIQAGLWTPDAAAPVWQHSDTEAGTGIFACVEALLNQAGRRIAEVDAFVFCEGPGSVLGIRTAAVALRTWRVINPSAATYTYQSLDLVARSLGRPELSVIADARRDTWHVSQLGQALRRVPSAELAGECVMPEHFRHWTPLPTALGSTHYEIATLLGTLSDAEVFRAVTEPDAFSHEEPSYVTWTPQIHQAPAPS